MFPIFEFVRTVTAEYDDDYGSQKFPWIHCEWDEWTLGSKWEPFWRHYVFLPAIPIVWLACKVWFYHNRVKATVIWRWFKSYRSNGWRYPADEIVPEGAGCRWRDMITYSLRRVARMSRKPQTGLSARIIAGRDWLKQAHFKYNFGLECYISRCYNIVISKEYVEKAETSALKERVRVMSLTDSRDWRFLFLGSIPDSIKHQIIEGLVPL